jgi:transposase InsO family protein
MPWTELTPMSQRRLFIERVVHRTGAFHTLCAQFGISAKTGYKWVARFAEAGPAGLADRSHRRHTLSHQVTTDVAAAVLACRRQHPTWGPRKLRVVLATHEPAIGWPAASTIGELLRRAGLSARRRRRVPVPPSPRALAIPPAVPNALWCADFKGQYRLATGADCYPLTITDHASRFLLGCTGLASTQTAPTQRVFRRVFETYGLPAALRTDNGVPFASTAIAGLSPLSVWWIRLGIRPERIAPGCPQQNGRHERMHLTLKKEATRPPGFNSLQQQERFDAFVREFNTERPHEALDMKCPAELYTASARSYAGLPDLTYPFHDRDVVVTACGRLCLHRKKINISTVLAGQKLGIKEVDEGIWLVSFMHYDLGYFDLEQKTLQPLDNPFGPKPLTDVSATTAAP